jgi:hypothetical protein
MKEILPPTVKKSLFFERIYFQEVDAEIYQERKN